MLTISILLFKTTDKVYVFFQCYFLLFCVNYSGWLLNALSCRDINEFSVYSSCSTEPPFQIFIIEFWCFKQVSPLLKYWKYLWSYKMLMIWTFLIDVNSRDWTNNRKLIVLENEKRINRVWWVLDTILVC